MHQYADEKQAADSHHLIEEFMLLANRLVAERLLETYPEHAIVRAQPPPEGRKLQNFLRSTIQRLRTFNELIQGVRTSWVQRRGLRRCRQAAGARFIFTMNSLQQSDVLSEDPAKSLRALVLQVQMIRCSSPAEYVCTGLAADWKHTSLG